VAGIAQSIAAALSSIRQVLRTHQIIAVERVIPTPLSQAAEAVMVAIVSSLDAAVLLQPVCRLVAANSSKRVACHVSQLTVRS
jgi:hypothetical protein